jgi:hypothetical protein
MAIEVNGDLSVHFLVSGLRFSLRVNLGLQSPMYTFLRRKTSPNLRLPNPSGQQAALLSQVGGVHDVLWLALTSSPVLSASGFSVKSKLWKRKPSARVQIIVDEQKQFETPEVQSSEPSWDTTFSM